MRPWLDFGCPGSTRSCWDPASRPAQWQDNVGCVWAEAVRQCAQADLLLLRRRHLSQGRGHSTYQEARGVPRPTYVSPREGKALVRLLTLSMSDKSAAYKESALLARSPPKSSPGLIIRIMCARMLKLTLKHEDVDMLSTAMQPEIALLQSGLH